MKKIPIFFLAVQALYPACCFCAKLFGWTMVLNNPVVYPAVATVLSMAMTVLAVRRKAEFDRREKTLISIALPVGLLNGLMLILAEGSIAAALISMACCFVMYKKGRRLKGLRILTSVLSAVLTLAVVALLPAALVFGEFGASSVLKSSFSPDGRYEAQIVDVDQGALGGNTTVRVRRSSGLFRVLEDICRFEKTVYIGDWGIGDALIPEWVDGDSLKIEGEIYDL